MPQKFHYPEYLDQILLEVRPGVILIDMQPEYLADLKKRDLPKLVENQARVLRLCAEHGLNVAVLEGKEFPSRTLSPLQEVIASISNAYYYSKGCPDGFTNPRFVKRVLEWRNRNHFYLGIYSDSCVLMTALSGFQDYGFTPLTAECVLGDTKLENLRSTRTWFRKNGVYID